MLEALESALYARQPGNDRSLTHHSDRGSQHVCIRYSERLAEAGAEPSEGSRGDSYDNALAETINGLYKVELIHRRATWKTRASVELATLNGSPGSTINACSPPSAIFQRPRLRQSTTTNSAHLLKRLSYFNRTASAISRAVQFLYTNFAIPSPQS